MHHRMSQYTYWRDGVTESHFDLENGSGGRVSRNRTRNVATRLFRDSYCHTPNQISPFSWLTKSGSTHSIFMGVRR